MMRSVFASMTLIVICFCHSSVVRAVPLIERWVSSVGVPVNLVQEHTLPMVDVEVSFWAGRAFEPPESTGVSSLLMATIQAGAGPLNEDAFAQRLDGVGAQLSTGLSADKMSFSLRTLSQPDIQETAIDTLALLLNQPSFPSYAVDRARMHLIENLKESETHPGAILGRAFIQKAYGVHPYGRLLTEVGLSTLTRADVLAFYQTNLRPEWASVTVVGDVSRAQAEAIVAKLFAGKSIVQSQIASRRAMLAKVEAPDAIETWIPHASEQSHIQLGLPVFAWGDADHIPLVVGNYTLGGGGGVSRLLQEVRVKRGLAYSVGSHFQPMARPGLFSIELQTQRDQAALALKVVNTTLDQFIQEGPTETELVAAKQFIIGSFPLRFDSNASLLHQVAMGAFYELPLDWFDRYPEKVQQVTLAQVKDAFARRVSRNHLVTVIVGGEKTP